VHDAVQPPSSLLSRAKSSVYIKESYYCCSLVSCPPASRMFPRRTPQHSIALWSPAPSVSCLLRYPCWGRDRLHDIIYLGLLKSGLSWAQHSAGVCVCVIERERECEDRKIKTLLWVSGHCCSQLITDLKHVLTCVCFHSQIHTPSISLPLCLPLDRTVLSPW